MKPVEKIVVTHAFPQLATRPEGIHAREYLVQRLVQSEHIELDFTDAVLTPSFADELIGKLVARIGRDEFSRKVTLSNVSSQTNALLEMVITLQLRNGVPAA